MKLTVQAPRKRSDNSVLVLAVLSPVIAEVLSGATHLTAIFALLPEILVWGLGAVLIREVARRLCLTEAALLFMGFALSLAEEILIQQTSLAPLPWLDTGNPVGRAFGVNWIYLLFQLGFESVWVVFVPIQLVELLFPHRCTEPWLKKRGLIVASLLFLFGSFIAWYAWIKRMRPIIFHLPPYHPSPYAYLAGSISIVALLATALVLRTPAEITSRRAPSPVLLFMAVLALGLPWYFLLVLQFSILPALITLPLWIPLVGGVAWGAFVWLTLRHWSLSKSWSTLHRYAAVFAAMLVPMLGGLLGANAWLRIDQIAQAVFDIAAIVCMILLGRSLKKRATAALDR